ncbi:hypothetical protein Naga_101654g1, partial [Nannochloropsis gaditana]
PHPPSLFTFADSPSFPPPSRLPSPGHGPSASAPPHPLSLGGFRLRLAVSGGDVGLPHRPAWSRRQGPSGGGKPVSKRSGKGGCGQSGDGSLASAPTAVNSKAQNAISNM